jgi:cation diffusion facilitator CzcD-associated flavoprotein CzcO
MHWAIRPWVRERMEMRKGWQEQQWGRNRRDIQRAKRMSGNMQLLGVGGPLNVSETWDVGGYQDSMWATLEEMPKHGVKELEETTSNT